MVTDVHDGHTHGPVLTDAEELSLLMMRRLDADADRLLLLVCGMDADDFVDIFRTGLSPQRLLHLIAALPGDRYRHLISRARSVARHPPAPPASD